MSLLGDLCLRCVSAKVSADSVCIVCFAIAFPLDAAVWCLPVMVLGPIWGFFTLKKETNIISANKMPTLIVRVLMQI